MKKYLIILIMLFCCYNIYAQPVAKVWTARYNGAQSTNMDRFGDMTVDKHGNIYVTGGIKYGASTNEEDCITMKYNTNGDTLWVARFNGAGNNIDGGNVIVTDSLGNVYIAGTTNNDYLVIKYNPNGGQVWVKIYNGPVTVDYATALTVDNAGNVYVSGTSLFNGTGQDYITIKYNSSGVQQWIAQYSADALYGTDLPEAIILDSQNNVYVAGSSIIGGNTSGAFDCSIVKYNSNGVLQWSKRYNGPGNGVDRGYDMAMDSQENVYVTGTSRGGASTQTDYVTIKYNAVNGDEMWVQRYNGPGFSSDGSRGIVVDHLNNIYITGASEGTSSTFVDIATIKYNINGVEQWVRRFDAGTKRDEGYDVEVDDLGDIYVTGTSIIGTDINNHDYVVLKYNPSGDLQWSERYNGPDNYMDVPYIVKLDPDKNIYISGYSNDVGRNVDIVSLKYIQSAPSAPTNLLLTVIQAGEIKLNWADNSLNEKSFKIQRKDNIDTAWALIDSVNADVNQWTQAGLTLGRTYYYRIYAVNSLGASINSNIVNTIITSTGNESTGIPAEYALAQNYPNPFNPVTKINYDIPKDGKVNLKIYDINGREVAALINNEIHTAGYYSVTFNAGNLSSGIYFYRLIANDFIQTKKMLLIK